MNCQETEIKIIDFLEGNLSKTELQDIEAHIASCEGCAKAAAETKILLGYMAEVKPVEPREEMRYVFTEMLEREKQQLPESHDAKVLSLTWKTAFQIAASLLLLLTGYVAGNYLASNKADSQIVLLQERTEELKTEMTLAMLDNSSASKRIQAVNYSEEMIKPDVKILNAIIQRMQFDANMNVRLTAAEALSRFSDNIMVKDAFIEALGSEKNSEIQIALIQFLVQAKDKRALKPMQQLLQEAEVPIFVKSQLNNGVKQLM